MSSGEPNPIRERRRRRRTAWRLIGLALIAYGLVGVGLLAVLGTALAAPIRDLGSISTSVENQRTAALDALRSASATVRAAADGVDGMDTSLGDAKAAIDRSSSIATNVAASMTQLADSMGLTIFGVQPLIGLQPGFSQNAAQLMLLAQDLGTIGQALDANRDDALAVATSLDALGTSLDELTDAVAAGPDLEVATASLDSVRLGVVAILVWLGVLAVGSIAAGAGCFWYARQL